MASTADRLTSIPVHASTLHLLQQLKTGAQNWDEFLLSALEDLLPPETITELARRERTESVRPYADIEKERAIPRKRRSKTRAAH